MRGIRKASRVRSCGSGSPRPRDLAELDHGDEAARARRRLTSAPPGLTSARPVPGTCLAPTDEFLHRPGSQSVTAIERRNREHRQHADLPDPYPRDAGGDLGRADDARRGVRLPRACRVRPEAGRDVSRASPTKGCASTGCPRSPSTARCSRSTHRAASSTPGTRCFETGRSTAEPPARADVGAGGGAEWRHAADAYALRPTAHP